jgi:hypothetical protein
MCDPFLGVARQPCSCYVLLAMGARVFDSDAPLDERRIIIRRYGGCLNCRGVSNPRNRVGHLSRSYAQRADRSRAIAAWCRHPDSGIAAGERTTDFALQTVIGSTSLAAGERSAWLDMKQPEHEAFAPFPGRSFAISHLRQGRKQAEFAISRL